MKRLKLYEPDDKMIDIISDNYSMLQGLNAFGIRLGFGDKSVEEVCHEQDVDCYTFLAVVNYIINDYAPKGNDDRICAKTLLAYLRASHRYFLDYQLPGIRKKLEDALLPGGDLTTLILFPYVEALMAGEPKSNYNVEMFAKYHSDTTAKLQELKNIIIKYLPHDDLSNNQLTTTLFDIYNIEEWLSNHSNVEEMIFVPAIRLLEKRVKSNDTSSRIYQILNGAESNETITEREKEIIVCLVQGMINKVIADKLNISVNTVITHRRNISRKLQIHSLAGLTLYAIANNLIDRNIIFG